MKHAAKRALERIAAMSVVARAVVAVPVSLSLWWFFLKGPSLWALRWIAYLPLLFITAPQGGVPVTVNAATGEWVFSVAVQTDAVNPGNGQRQHVESLDFAADPENVAYFAYSWFSYLGLALSAGLAGAETGKRLAKGLACQTFTNVLCLVCYVYINGYGTVVNGQPGAGGQVWFLKYLYYLIYLVIPFAGPFAIALLFHPEWRNYFSMWEAPASHDLPRAPAARGKQSVRTVGAENG